MKPNNDRRKMLRLLTFILSALLVTTASAAVYSYMYIQASPIGVGTPTVRFVSGNDATSTIGQNGTFAQITSMVGWPNATRIYQDALRIQNMEASPKDCGLSLDTFSGNTTYVNYIYVKIFDTIGGTQQGGTLSVVGGNSTGTFSLAASATWYVQWEINWQDGAESTYSVDVTLKLQVS